MWTFGKLSILLFGEVYLTIQVAWLVWNMPRNHTKWQYFIKLGDFAEEERKGSYQ